MVICDTNSCTGCGACLNVCPKRCIQLKEDEYGALKSYVDSSLCVRCHKCKKVCPIVAKSEFNYPSECYAAWLNDPTERARCASGGIGYALAEYVIRVKHGVVFGTAYNQEMVPCTIFAETIDEARRFKGSKYVQSVISDSVYREMRQFLDGGRYVLYIGTPCQIAGAKLFLGRKYENFVTVDLICHGVSPTKYFCDEIKEQCKQKQITNLRDVRFRGNDGLNSKLSFCDKILGKTRGNNFVLTLWERETNGNLRRHYCGNWRENYYLSGFMLGITLRKNCYTCQFARPERISDITIGDFIGLGDTVPFAQHQANVSCVLVNTCEGRSFYSEFLSEMHDVESVRREYEERLAYAPSLVEPFREHWLASKFRNNFRAFGYVKGIKQTMRWYLVGLQLVRLLKMPKTVVKLLLKRIHK